MKKLMSLAALALCVLLLGACSVAETLDDVAAELRTANTEEAPAEASAPWEPEAATETDTDTVGQTQEPEAEAPAQTATGSDAEPPQYDLPVEENRALAELTLSELVTDAEGASGQLPRIAVECAGAAEINEDIEGSFRYLVDADYCSLRYDCYKNDTVLSLVVIESFDGDSTYYTPYNLDLVTGSRMSGEALIAYLGLDAQAVADAELEKMEEEFTHLYGLPGEGADPFLNEQYARTVSADNADTRRVWLDEFGRLFFAARIYSLAGAEFYEYPMDTGFAA